MKIVLLGAPGAGKGSQATKLTEYYKIVHISTGDAFRMNIANKTEIGLYAKTFIDKGLLVPDEVTVGIVESRLKFDDCKNGYLLDGFPRNIAQAEALEKISKPDAVIDIVTDFDLVIKRLTGRRSCTCGKIYHISTYKDSVCEKCGSKLYVRDDDKEEAIKQRLEVYSSTTAPLTEYYKKKGILKTVDGNCTIDETFELIKAALK